MSKKLFFIALLPPLEIQQTVTKIKSHFAKNYNSKAALKSPPHITLQPPFYWESDRLLELKTFLQKFVRQQTSIPIILDGFAVFEPRVVYIDVRKTSELLAAQKKLMQLLESSLKIVQKTSKNRSFNPHMTVGFKDLSKANFYKAWTEFREQNFYFEFIVSEITLLQHNGKIWEISSEFAF